jgi:hypothetical protein
MSHTKPPDTVIFGWVGGDSEHYVFVMDEEPHDDRERPIALWAPAFPGGCGLIANSFPEFLEYCLAQQIEVGYTETETHHLRTLLATEFGVRSIRNAQQIADAARASRYEPAQGFWHRDFPHRTRPTASASSPNEIFPTQDRIGISLPRDIVDRRFMRSIEWEPTSLTDSIPLRPHLLDEAEKRLRKGDIGTALILARDYRFHHWFDDWDTDHLIIRRTALILNSAYRQLNRRTAAANIINQTRRALVNLS